MFGKLTWSAIPFHEPIVMVTSAVVALTITAVLAWVIVKGHLPYLWKEWLSSVDHKRIGVMYIVLALVMLLRGFADAVLMRSQQAVAMGSAETPSSRTSGRAAAEPNSSPPTSAGGRRR